MVSVKSKYGVLFEKDGVWFFEGSKTNYNKVIKILESEDEE